ncbi:hypothetical protein XV94_16395 [Vibrio metoecus]|nr:hypothetical protein XV94_16395 [Vibrio metoecus]
MAAPNHQQQFLTESDNPFRNLASLLERYLQSQIEHLQSVLSFIEMQPLLKALLLKEQSHQALN